MVALLVFYCASYGAATFTVQPKTTDETVRIKIEFTLSEYTDVTVEVMDSSGATIRHLASGKLGANPPSPLQVNSLSQTIYWDLLNDDGNRFYGNYDVKVGLGLTAALDRFYGSSGINSIGYIGSPNGVAVDSSGNVIVMTAAWRGAPVKIMVMSRTGGYVRTICPYPGDLPSDKMQGFGRVPFPGGKSMPVIYQGHHGLTIPGIYMCPPQGMVVAPQGWLIMTNYTGTGYAFYNLTETKRRVIIMGLDGSCPRDTLFGPVLSAGKDPGMIHLAVTADGRNLYASGLAYDNRIKKSLLDYTGLAQPFAGDSLAGSDNTHFNKPRGVDVDASGNVYVADYGNNRVMVLDSTGAFKTSFTVKSPDHVKINKKNGDIFILSVEPATAYVKVIKYSPFPVCDSVAAFSLSGGHLGGTHPPVMTLDYNATPPTVWVGGLVYVKPEMTGVLDQGSSLTASSPQTIGAKTSDCWKGGTLGIPGYITVSPDEKVMYAGCGSWARVDLVTGAISTSSIVGLYASFGPDGTLYTSHVLNPQYQDSNFYRYDANGTRIPFENGAMIFGGPTNYAWEGWGSRGFTVARNGDIYVFHPRNQRISLDSQQNVVSVYDKNLQLKQRGVIKADRASGGIQVDLQGNIYIADNVKPKGVTYPSPFMGLFKDPTQAGNTWPFSYVSAPINYYLFAIGCVFKFPPSGGYIRYLTGGTSSVPVDNIDGMNVPQTQVSGMYHYTMGVSGPAWQYFGISPNAALENMGDPSCACISPRFTVDDFGRVFVPDGFRFSVVVLDNNKNEILRFGEYGNQDQQGPSSSRPTPSIPLAYPAYITKVNNSVYVSDVGNDRVAKVKLDYSQWATASGKLSVGQSAVSPQELALSVFPQPFNPGTDIQIRGVHGNTLSVMIFDMAGRLVRDLTSGAEVQRCNVFTVAWDGKDRSKKKVGAGVYLAKARIGNKTLYRNLVLAK